MLSASNAASVGAKTVNAAPSSASVSARLALVTAASRAVKFSLATTISVIVLAASVVSGGSRTLSMTCMTPLEASMSYDTTFEKLTYRLPSPGFVKATSSPFCVATAPGAKAPASVTLTAPSSTWYSRMPFRASALRSSIDTPRAAKASSLGAKTVSDAPSSDSASTKPAF